MNLKELAAHVGGWEGTSSLFLPGNPPDTAPSSLTVTEELGGRFVRIDYTWAAAGKPQQGSMLVGGDSACWVDTWHMSDKMLQLVAEEGLRYRGSYPAPPGPDWGWLIEIGSREGKLTIAMMNIEPDGAEEPAVAAEYSPVTGLATAPRAAS